MDRLHSSEAKSTGLIRQVAKMLALRTHFPTHFLYTKKLLRNLQGEKVRRDGLLMYYYLCTELHRLFLSTDSAELSRTEENKLEKAQY